MTVVERKAASGNGKSEYLVRPLYDREQIRGILEARRPYAAYALGQLDPALFRMTDWRTAVDGSNQALVLSSSGGLGNATFAMGESEALDALMRVHPGPRQTFLTCEVHHLETILRHFDLDQRQTMIRMRVTPESFTTAPGVVRRLHGGDVRNLNRLYRTEGVPSFYSPTQIEDGVYYGAEQDGVLVSVAGTHVISHASAIAVIGNVYTHPRYRGQHLAEATTSAATEQLLRFCHDIVLSVDPTNIPAVSAYRRLGYVEVARLIEGAATRRDALGAGLVFARAIARFRGRRAGGELVRIRSA